MYLMGNITINGNVIQFYYDVRNDKHYLDFQCNNRNGSRYVIGDKKRIHYILQGLQEIMENSKWERYLEFEIEDMGIVGVY